MAKGGKNNSMITFQDGMMLDNDKLNQSTNTQFNKYNNTISINAI